jgi:peptidoglycan/LPS O-acetylase OafA/YrhL
MWIPHRVFFGNVAFVAAVAIGVLLLAWQPLDWRRTAAAVLGPSAVAGAFQGFILTSGIPPTLWQRIGIGLLACTMISVWLLAAAGTIGGLRRLGARRVFQALGGGVVAAIFLMLTRVVLG